ncbi:MAG: menaquinone-dependent protoporphyrinogen IX dehydrogenase [Usitatibacteraceae bacterium]
MMNVLLIYSTVDGHTLEICSRIGAALQLQNHHVRVVPVAEGGSVDLASFDKYVIGASIRYGKHRPELVEFLQSNGPTLASRPNAFFSVNVVARKPGKNRPETNPYMQKLLKKLAWRPQQLAVFAGKIEYPRYRFFDKQMIRLIMWLTGGPTGPRDVVDFTDWAEVDAFAQVIERM